MRLAGQLHRLARCLVALGVDEQLAIHIASRAALRLRPARPLQGASHVATQPPPSPRLFARSAAATAGGAKWELAALEAIGMVEVEGPDEFDDPQATRLYGSADATEGCTKSSPLSYSSLSIGDGNGGEQPTDSYTPEAA